MVTSRDLLNSTLTNKFDMGRFQEFIVQFFNNSKMVDPNNKRQDYWNWNEYSYYINGFFHVAEYLDPNRKKIAVFAVELKKGKSLEKARSKQRNFIADRIKNSNYDGAITAFYSEDPQENKWRLSFVRLDYEFLKGKVKTNFTPAKRYSYLVGADEPCHTAMQQLFPILEDEKFNPTLDKIEEAFSVEKVTKQFFEKYKEKYFEIKEYLMSNTTFTEEAARCIKNDDEEEVEKFTEQFAKKLMGQIAFMYFLQKKGWMGVNAIPQTITESQFKNLFFYNALSKKFANDLYIKVADNEYRIVPSVLRGLSEDEELAVAASLKGKAWGEGPKDFVRRLYDDAVKNNKYYFDDYLEPLFYEALNEKRPANNYFTKLHCRIPFLNGGLFEPYYDWKNNRFSIPNHIFSNKDIKGERDADGILDIFDRYNFTMNEDEPLEKEVAVDPEMLGKIFENLLDAKDRKSKGAFYTPREIVHYMCQESLINYLVNTVGTPYEDTKDFILYGEIMKDEDCSREVKQGIANMLIPESIYVKLNDIDKALADVRIADPAVGSGAFPMGMINEIVKARDVITDYRARDIELDGKKKGISDKQIAFLKANEHNLRNLYNLKKDAMFNSIYAVDIEPSAVDIAKLRLWLSLVVEFEVSADEPNPPTLPNLDCHIICGNSLIDEFEGVKLFNSTILTGGRDLISNTYSGIFDTLYDLERKFFYAQNHTEKYEYKNQIEEIKLSIIESALIESTNDIKERFLATRNLPSKPYTLWQLEFSKVFKEKGGFDIVIGNPPYIDSENMVNSGLSEEREYIIKHYNFTKGNWDIYIAFFELAHNLINHEGNLIYITPDKWISKPFGEVLRKSCLQGMISILNAGRDVFETALVDSIVTQIGKIELPVLQSYRMKEKKVVFDKIVDKKIFKDSCQLDILFSDSIDLISKIENNAHQLSEIAICENACATADCYKLKPFIHSLKNANDFSSDKFKIINTGTIDKFVSRWDLSPMKYLKDSYYFPIVDKKEFLENFNNSYGQKAGKKKLILKGLNLLDACLDIDGIIIPGKSTMIIPSEDENKLFLLMAFLNSKIMFYYIKQRYSSSSYNGGITFTKDMINSFPMKINNESKEKIIKLSRNIFAIRNNDFTANYEDLLNEIDNILYKVYDLTAEEISIIENNK